jgi:hypothetical protein
MKTAVAMCLLFACAAFGLNPASSQNGANIRFSFDNPQLQPSAYTLQVFENGSGSYSAGGPDVQAADQAIRVQDPLLAKLFQVARANHFFATDCESKQHGIAFTGKKTLNYSGSDGSGSCTFNYAHDAALNQLASDLMAVAYTLQMGERLKSEHRYDRLSLNSELEALQSAAKDRQALELENIAPELQSIADDDAVMNLARNRARALLSESSPAR